MSLTQKLWVLRLPKPHSPYLRKTNWTLDLYLIRYTLKTLRISIAISHFFGRAKAVGGLLSSTIFQQGKKIFFFLSLFLPFFCHSYPKRKNSLYNPNMFVLARYSNYDAREHKNSRYQTKIPLNWNKNYSQCNMTDVNEPVFLVLRVGVTS